MSERFYPYSPSTSRHNTTEERVLEHNNRHNNTEERVLENNNNNSSRNSPLDHDRVNKEKDDWLRNFRQFQPSSSNSNSNDVTNTSDVSSGRQSVSATWNQGQQRISDALGSSRNYSASQHHQDCCPPDCNLPQCHMVILFAIYHHI